MSLCPHHVLTGGRQEGLRRDPLVQTFPAKRCWVSDVERTVSYRTVLYDTLAPCRLWALAQAAGPPAGFSPATRGNFLQPSIMAEWTSPSDSEPTKLRQEEPKPKPQQNLTKPHSACSHHALTTEPSHDAGQQPTKHEDDVERYKKEWDDKDKDKDKDTGKGKAQRQGKGSSWGAAGWKHCPRWCSLCRCMTYVAPGRCRNPRCPMNRPTRHQGRGDDQDDDNDEDTVREWQRAGVGAGRHCRPCPWG